MESDPHVIIMPQGSYHCDFCGREEERPPLVLFVGSGADMRTLELCTHCMGVIMRHQLPHEHDDQNQPDGHGDSHGQGDDKDGEHE